ncbi:MAG TPA: SatD family protein [Caulobacteraceae bacterium]|nr:SatD family protein [Caulobacteraceae bacterium]
MTGDEPTADSWPRTHTGFTHAVIMGDIVGSETAPSVTRLHQIFNAAVAAANEEFGEALVAPLTITLGDEFQGLATGLSLGFAIISRVRYTLLAQGVACRFALGIASIQTPVDPARAWNLMGPGLAQTRTKLEEKRRAHAYRFHLPSEPVIESLLEAVGLSLTLTEADWTERQREIALRLLPSLDLSTADLADEIGVGRRTVNKIRSAARVDFYAAQWQAIQTALEALDRSYGFADV